MVNQLVRSVLGVLQSLGQGFGLDQMQQSEQRLDALELETLHLGDSGESVQRLQGVLADLLLYNGGIDGSFGPMTERAVQVVQRHFKLPVTGQFDAAAWYAIALWSDELRNLPAAEKQSDGAETVVDRHHYGLA